MKRLCSLIAVVGLMLVTVFPNTSKAYSANAKELAERSVSNYIKAVQTGDIIEATKWVIDSRFKAIDEQIAEYQDSLSTNPFSKVYLESIVPNSDSSFTAILNLVRKDSNELNKISLPVVNDNGEWKLLIEGTETMSNAVRERIQIEKKLDGMNEAIISPLVSVNLGNYEEWLKKADSTYSGKFDMVGSSIGVSGWQYQPGFSDDRTVVYQIVDKGFFSDDVKGEKTLTGYYSDEHPSSNSFYITIKITDAASAPKGVYLKAKNASSISGVFVKGYIYKNR
ncbi:hypothetical protein [Paenibacillus alvei]|uniref:hypothetical protein n=1 Tax=Paenibacillus alvei TaxID=44250 RepID=UPI00227DF434|nr:hypothetical protein [Paenibacillus alvei]